MKKKTKKSTKINTSQREKKTGRKPLTGKKKLMYESLKSNLGNVSISVKMIGIERTTHYLWLRTDPNYKLWVSDTSEITKDFVENALLKNIKKGNAQAQIFYLKTKAKDRGYVERQEIEHSTGNQGVVINLVEKSVKEIKDGISKRRKEADKEGTRNNPQTS